MRKQIKVFLGADHAGFEAKEKIKSFLAKKGITYDDLGAYSYKRSDDYPDFATKVAKVISKNGGSKGILVCGTGAGMAMAANKFKGVRAVEAYDQETAKLSREHNDANILALGARTLSFEKMQDIILVWLKADFSKEFRHKRRLKKISELEKR